MKRFSHKLLSLFMLVMGLVASSPNVLSQPLSPTEFFSFVPGEHKKLLGWNAIVSYFEALAASSERVMVQEIGRSAHDLPVIMTLISSGHNLSNLARFKNLQKQAANPGHLSMEDVDLLARSSKAVVMLVMNQDSREIASSLASMDLAYHLASDESSKIQAILDEILILMIPSMHPDGQQNLSEWYSDCLGKPCEGTLPPGFDDQYEPKQLAHDGIFMELPETKWITRQIYKEWFPQVLYGTRFLQDGVGRLILPPYASPFNKNLNPLVIERVNEISRRLILTLLENGKKGITSEAIYGSWWEGDPILTPSFHNMLGIVSELAMPQVATPIFYPVGSQLPTTERVSGYHPRYRTSEQWDGGWWQLQDSMEYLQVMLLGLLEYVSANKARIIADFCRTNIDAIRKPPADAPWGYVIAREQHDTRAMEEMVAVLLRAGAEIYRTEQPLVTNETNHVPGSFVIPMAQPSAALIRNLLEKQRYLSTDNGVGDLLFHATEMTGWTLPLMMGVQTHELKKAPDALMTRIDTAPSGSGRLLGQPGQAYLVHHTSNISFSLVNHLLAKEKIVYWLKQPQRIGNEQFAPGAVYFSAKDIKEEEVDFLARQLSLEIVQTGRPLLGEVAYELHSPRIGIYRPFFSSEAASWLGHVLELYEFSFQYIRNHELRRSDKSGALDVIIFPDLPADTIVGDSELSTPKFYQPQWPLRYRGGISQDGVRNLKDFVLKGGTLVLLGRAADLAIDEYGLAAENVLKQLDESDFACPGALLKVKVDPANPFSYGMPEENAVMFQGGAAFRTIPWSKKTGVAAYYPESDLVLSGWVKGSENLHGLAAMVDIPMGNGRVVLIGFDPTFHSQTRATFKFMLNTIMLASAKDAVIEK